MGMVLIQQQTLGSAAPSVTFNSIPQTYKALRLCISGRLSSGSPASTVLSFNGNTLNRATREMYGNGTTVSTAAGSTMYADLSSGATDTASVFSSSIIEIPDYTSASAYKSSIADCASENNSSVAYLDAVSNLWSDTTAITSLTCTAGGGVNYATASSFTLYGIG